MGLRRGALRSMAAEAGCSPPSLSLRTKVKVSDMRFFWERTGGLGAIYRLVGEGFGDQQIADKPNITETKVRDCISWMLRFFRFPDGMELARDAFGVEHPSQTVT